MNATTTQPLIGVTTRHGNADWVQRNTRNYLDRLQEYDAIPIVLSPDTTTTFPDGVTFTPDGEGRLPAAVLARLDGLILSGGGDVDPKYFGQPLNGADPKSIDHKRDELELHLGRWALAADLPTFAICRGCQVLNVAAGGGMVQHMDNHRSASPNTLFHPVQLLGDTRLRSIVGTDTLQVNTFHHQGVDHATLAPIFVPAGIAKPDQWLVEAYESRLHTWVIGVQWHPERTFELVDGHRKLWDSFMAVCRANAAKRRTA